MYKLNESQEQSVNNLEETYNVLSEILTKDPDGLVISGTDRHKLEELINRNKELLRKLRTGEFAVAVVGLENSGKSTLGNAFLKTPDVLPEDSIRCTYTKTEIRSCSEDYGEYGEVIFYSYDEFNDDFKRKLRQLKYNGNADFSSLDIESFDRFLKSMAGKDPEYPKKTSNIAMDIRAILEGRKDIADYLGKSPMEFIGAGSLTNPEFRFFITGIKDRKENSEGGNIPNRSAIPYAVKEVKMRSANLRDMSHIVLYDVPGFNSPTALHKKLTEEMLIDADAIIFVANVDENPNIDDRQLGIFQAGCDAYGIYFNEKSFFFGNKLDKANDEQIAKNNMAMFRQDVVKRYHIADERHVFFGSAKAYLDKVTGVNSKSISTLLEWNMPIGIDELRNSVREYHNNERFDVLRKRAEKTLHDTTEFLRDILDHTQEAIDQPSDGGEILLQIKNSLSEFVKESKLILDGYKADIARETPFSKLITDNIDSIYASVSKDDEIVRSAEARQNLDTSRIYPAESVDVDIRKKLHRNFISEIVSRTADATHNKEQEIYTALSRKFLDILDVPESSMYYDELEQSIRSVFDDIRVANDGETCRFNTLVKRFTTSLIESIILHPFASNSRLQNVRDNCLTEFFSLAVYYATQKGSFGKNIELSNDSERLQMFTKIMTHDMENGGDENSDNYKALEEHFRNQGIDPELCQLPIGKWADKLDKVKLEFADKTNELKRSVNKVLFDGNWNGENARAKIDAIDDIISKICHKASTQTCDSKSGGLKAYIKDLHEDTARKKRAMEVKVDDETMEPDSRNSALQTMMLNNINIDIVNLRDITVNAVVKAINLEQAFISVINDNVEFIRKDAEAEDMSNMGKFDVWINVNKSKIRNNEYAQIERNKTDNITRQNIIETINRVLNKLKV